MDSSNNNGGQTDYYKLPKGAKECSDIIDSHDMSFNQGEIFKASFCFGRNHSGRTGSSTYERDLFKIIHYAKRELIIEKKRLLEISKFK